MALLLVVLTASLPCFAADARPPFKFLRYDEDYRFLADPAQRTDWWDPIKYIPLAQGRAGFLSLGGDLRTRFETYRNEFFSTKSSADNAYLLQRYLLHADYHPIAIASGDDSPNDRSLQTLNPLFPRGNYFTEAAMLGPQNFFDVHPCLRLQPSDAWFIDLGADFYWRESLDDGIYTPGGGVIYAGNSDFARFVGTDLSLLISWQATRHINLSTAYTHFFAGKFVDQNEGEDVDYGAVWASYRF